MVATMGSSRGNKKKNIDFLKSIEWQLLFLKLMDSLDLCSHLYELPKCKVKIIERSNTAKVFDTF
jgi:hypothetical protein